MAKKALLPTDTSTNPATSDVIPDHPLASLAGKYEGDFWETTLQAIQDERNRDRKKKPSTQATKAAKAS
jgi:hypothetical protein